VRPWILIASLSVAACAEPRRHSEPCEGCVATIHPVGILDPGSDAFHGKELARRDWDFALCAKCHGDDFSGGNANKSCLTCHAEGPTACVTCHGEGPTTGAHALHRAADHACAECHVVPERWDAPGHIVGDVAPAEVVFGALAAHTLDPADRAGPPAWDGQRCQNVYCHGDVLRAGGGSDPQPRWAQAAPTGSCTACHGGPPPSHARADCATCHPASAGHIDGIVQIGRTSGCDGCHGSATSIAPPVDLAGNTFTTALGVGAHQAHLQAPSGLRGPIACTTCHVVPASLTSPGHLDAAPADVVAGVGWDRDARTCATWCHGTVSPPWTSTGLAVCGSCHGVPPADANHAPTMALTSCVTCHARTVNELGNILVEGGTSNHMDGDVDGN
jgi:predicted CxxxxCH...CXXCH cytochrome family protein